MTSKDLRTGMLVKLEDGSVCVVFRECLRVAPEGIITAKFALVDARGDVIYGDGYTDALEHKRHPSANIVEVRGSEVFNPRCILDLMDNKFEQSPCLWKRQVTKKMTLEEIEKILGHKVDIVNQPE